MTMDDSVAEVTVRVEVPEMLPSDAVIVVEPSTTGVARPLEPAALLMAATSVFDELQTTPLVRSCTEPPE
ncbi:MAG TPA: hypothetical protein VEI57_06575 [Nitrospirota bacterium]|nr:hypothetical protein [Nitrospirota bacterium]